MRHLTLNQEYQNQTAQLMFSFGEEQQYDIPVRQVTTCSKTDTKLSTVPEYLNNLSKDCFSLEELLGKINADTVYFGRNKRGQIANVNGNVIFAGGMASRILPMPFYGQFLMLWLKARDIWNSTHLWLLLAILMIVQDCGMQN